MALPYGSFKDSSGNTHQLMYTEGQKNILPGVKQERHFHCKCGKKFYGYDNKVGREMREHKAAVQNKSSNSDTGLPW